MNNIYILGGSIIISGAMISGAVLYSGNNIDREALVAQGVDSTNKANEVQIDARELDIENWPTKGDPNAPVVIVEYSDYVCPFCKRLKDETISQIEENYVKTGKVLLVFKDLPVVGGNLAAEAAHCAGEQNSYWEYHNLLFENQATDRGSWSNPEIHRGYAEKLGLNANSLIKCFQERRYEQKVQESTREAQSLGGRGTPFLIVNTQVVTGAQPYQVFRQVIEQELNK